MSIQFVSNEMIRQKSDIVITFSQFKNNPGVNVNRASSDGIYSYNFDCTVISAAYYSYSFMEDSVFYNTTEDYIRGCYRTMLLQIADYACESAELPLIWSSDIDLTQEQILHIASETILEFLDYYDMKITVSLPTNKPISINSEQLEKIHQTVQTRYIPSTPIQMPKSHLTETQKIIKKMLLDGDYIGASDLVRLNSLDELMSRKDKPFATHLFRMIDNSGMTDAEVYKGALLDRKLFSKIRNGNNYTPRKGTILALAISMRLTLDETQNLLRSAGYALSDSSEMDIIVGYFIDHNIFDIFKVNEALDSFGLKGLGNISE